MIEVRVSMLEVTTGPRNADGAIWRKLKAAGIPVIVMGHFTQRVLGVESGMLCESSDLDGTLVYRWYSDEEKGA